MTKKKNKFAVRTNCKNNLSAVASDNAMLHGRFKQIYNIYICIVSYFHRGKVGI